MNAAQAPRRITDAATLAAWTRYMAESRAAKLQYQLWPISLGRAGSRSPCRRTCGRKTESITGVCQACEREEKR